MLINANVRLISNVFIQLEEGNPTVSSRTTLSAGPTGSTQTKQIRKLTEMIFISNFEKL